MMPSTQRDRRFTRSVLAVWLSLALGACTESAAPLDGVVAFDSPVVERTALTGSTLSVAARLQNHTGQRLQCLDFLSSCSCQAVFVDGRRITAATRCSLDAGEELELRVDVQVKSGFSEDYVSCKTDAPGFPVVALKLRIEGEARVALDPPELAVGDSELGKPVPYRFVARSPEGRPFEVSGVFGIVGARIQREAADRWVIEGEFIPPARGTYARTIEVHTDIDRPRSCVLLGRVPELLTLEPSCVVLSSKASRVLVRSAVSGLRVRGCEVTAENGYAEFLDVAIVEPCVVEVRVRDGAPRGIVNGSLTLDFGGDIEPRVVRVFGRVSG